MNPEVKAKWLKALRSGKYRQTERVLRDTDREGKTGFCCLGVLCNLHAEAHPEIAKNQCDPHSYLGVMNVLPTAVQEWAGIDEEGTLPKEVLFRHNSYDTLYELNDDGMSFKKIANVIDRLL